MLMLINANCYQTEEKKHVDCCHVEQYTSQVINSLHDNMVDELAMPCPDRGDYYA